MKYVIIEDETPARRILSAILKLADPHASIVGEYDSVREAVAGISTVIVPDLIFLDIQLSDGTGFDFLEQSNVTYPVVFTTAYDQFLLKAFRYNSIDYIMKPVSEEQVCACLAKLEKLRSVTVQQQLKSLMESLPDFLSGRKKYRERFLIKAGKTYLTLKATEIAWFYNDGKYCHAVDFSGNTHLVEYNLITLEADTDQRIFFRINRSVLINIDAIRKIRQWDGNRLYVETMVPHELDATVSREKVQLFKQWLNAQ